MGDCFLGERLSCRGLRVVRAITYSQGLDIFYLQNVVLAAAVNMTRGGGGVIVLKRLPADALTGQHLHTPTALINVLLSQKLVHIVILNGNIWVKRNNNSEKG